METRNTLVQSITALTKASVDISDALEHSEAFTVADFEAVAKSLTSITSISAVLARQLRAYKHESGVYQIQAVVKEEF